MSVSKRSNFRPLQIINEERSTHGLRYGDYTRYRKHCAAKTHRLRSSLKLTHGKGRDFKKLPPIVADAAKEGHLLLLLFETERAWTHAQELSAPQDARRSTARYRRSHSYLARLLTLARAPDLAVPLTAQAVVELVVYALIHTARFNLRRPSASTAAYYTLHGAAAEEEDDTTGYPLVQLSVAHALLDELERSAGTSKEVALARAFKDEIGPEIRWCIHEFSRGSEGSDSELEGIAQRWKKREWDIEGIVGDVAPVYSGRVVSGYEGVVRALREEAAERGDMAGKKEVLEELVWDGEVVPVRNPELVDVLLRVQEARKRLKGEEEVKAKGRGKMAKYDAVLASLSDAVDVARKLVEAQQVSGSSSTAAPGQRDMAFMHSLLTYLHLTYRIERDLILLSALTEGDTHGSNNAAILHLLSGILQSLSQTLTLAIVDESPELSTAITLRVSHAKAERALHLARAYAHPSQKRYAEAVALTQRGLLHIREARSTLPGSEHVTFYPLDETRIGEAETRLTKEEEGYKRAWFGGAVFFDIAYNYIEAPVDRLRARAGLSEMTTTETSRKAKAEEAAVVIEAEVETPKQTPGRGGLGGFLGSWWGRR